MTRLQALCDIYTALCVYNANSPRPVRVMDCSKEVCQEEPKEEPVSDIVLPNSTSLDDSITGGGGVVIGQDAQCCWVEFVKVVTKGR